MKLLLVLSLIVLQGCAAFTRRNFIDLNGERKDSVRSHGTLGFEDSDFEVTIHNRNSNLMYLAIGPFIPIVPISLFSSYPTPNEHLTVELVLASKAGSGSRADLDFSSMKIEEPQNKDARICWQYSVREIKKSKEFDLNFLETEALFASGKKLYQIYCKMAAKSIPSSEGTFLKISGIKALDSKTQKSFPLPDLVFSYRRELNYEFFSPQ